MSIRAITSLHSCVTPKVCTLHVPIVMVRASLLGRQRLSSHAPCLYLNICYYYCYCLCAPMLHLKGLGMLVCLQKIIRFACGVSFLQSRRCVPSRMSAWKGDTGSDDSLSFFVNVDMSSSVWCFCHQPQHIVNLLTCHIYGLRLSVSCMTELHDTPFVSVRFLRRVFNTLDNLDIDWCLNCYSE